MSLIKSFGYAFRGMWIALAGRNMRIHLVAALVVVALVVAYSVTGVHEAVLVTSVVIVLAGEMINTSIEWICDLIEQLHGLPRPNVSIQKIKDVAAGAVLVLAIGAAYNGWIVFSPFIK
jgi:diacylglycerol kinase